MSSPSQPPGWYPAQGDPPGTVRWWDGGQWVGGPQAPGIQQQTGYIAPGAKMLPNGRELADPWMRVAAAVIDGLLVGFINFALGAVLGVSIGLTGSFGDGSDGFNFVTEPTFILATLAVTTVIVTYHTLMNTFLSGGVGKQVLGLRIVRADGTEPLGVPVGIKRSGNHLADLLGVIPIVGPLVLMLGQGLLNLVSLVFLFTDPEHRTVMDRFADTYVVTKQ